MEQKVKIIFMTDYIYDNSFFTEFQEMVMSLSDAVELVNNHVAVIDHIYV